MALTHPLLEGAVVAAIERAASAHLGRPWVSRGFTDLSERASHPCGVLDGEPFSVFAMLAVDGPSSLGRQCLTRLASAVRRYS
jgi:hypothetical protein